MFCQIHIDGNSLKKYIKYFFAIFLYKEILETLLDLILEVKKQFSQSLLKYPVLKT